MLDADEGLDGQLLGSGTHPLPDEPTAMLGDRTAANGDSIDVLRPQGAAATELRDQDAATNADQ